MSHVVPSNNEYPPPLNSAHALFLSVYVVLLCVLAGTHMPALSPIPATALARGPTPVSVVRRLPRPSRAHAIASAHVSCVAPMQSVYPRLPIGHAKGVVCSQYLLGNFPSVWSRQMEAREKQRIPIVPQPGAAGLFSSVMGTHMGTLATAMRAVAPVALPVTAASAAGGSSGPSSAAVLPASVTVSATSSATSPQVRSARHVRPRHWFQRLAVCMAAWCIVSTLCSCLDQSCSTC